MRIITPPDFISKIKNKHLLLDTNVFIDTSLHEEKFGKFLNELKNNGVTLLTLEVVMIEFTKGAPTKEKFNTKKTTVEKIRTLSGSDEQIKSGFINILGFLVVPAIVSPVVVNNFTIKVLLELFR